MLFQFYYESMKKIIGYVRLQMTLLRSPIRASTLLAGPPLSALRVRTLWMTLFINFEIFYDSLNLIGTPNPPAATTPHQHHASPAY